MSLSETERSSVARLTRSVISLTLSVYVSVVLSSLLSGKIEFYWLWIVSPSGKTTVPLPFYTALRVVRKHGWGLAEVEPVRRISRRDALKILVKGDKHR